MEPPHKLAIAEAQVRAGQTHPPAFVRHVISGRGRSTCRSPAPPGRLFRSLALAQSGRWKADAGAAFPPPAAPRGRHSSGSRRFRAPRPSEVPGSPFHRRSAPRGAPCGARISPSGGPRDTFAEFPGLFPAPSLALSRSVFALALATARAYRYASLPLGSYDLPPAYVSRQGPPRNLAQLAGASGGGCGARPSRLRAGSLTPTRGRRFGDQPKQAALAFGMRESLIDSGSGRRAPADTRKEPT